MTASFLIAVAGMTLVAILLVASPLLRRQLKVRTRGVRALSMARRARDGASAYVDDGYRCATDGSWQGHTGGHFQTGGQAP